MEFLIGRTLINNIINLGVEHFVREDLRSDPRQDWKEVLETEPDAGLGNGGLGRLAACFLDSLATLQIPAVGYRMRHAAGTSLVPWAGLSLAAALAGAPAVRWL